MTSPRRQAEADRVEIVYYYVLNEIGAETVEDAIALWNNEVSAGDRAGTTVARWLDRAIFLILSRRDRSRDLALAYYRLVRALRTGRTVADPRKPEPAVVSLEMLRQEFEALVDELAPDPQNTAQEPQNQPLPDEQVDAGPSLTPEVQDALAALSEDDADDDDQILLDEIRELEELIGQEEDEAEAEAERLLRQIAEQKLQRDLEELDAEQRAEDFLAQQEELMRKAAAAAAAHAERITMNAARGLVYDIASADKLVIGWARYSETGTPCAWCRMLLSRGVVYKSRQLAGSSRDEHGQEVEDVDRYHPNCHCVAVPIFAIEHFDQSDLFDLNRFYLALWNKHIKGKYGGDEALTVWRRLIRQLDAEQLSDATQAAA